jgi:hypothetical protein
MRKLVIIVLLVAGLAYGVPLANESADTPCNALEKRFVTLSTKGGTDPDVASLGRAFLGGLQNFSKGSFAIEYVRREHPNLPAGIACVEEYWRSFLPDAGPQRRP